jgi:hypothetical protein
MTRVESASVELILHVPEILLKADVIFQDIQWFCHFSARAP